MQIAEDMLGVPEIGQHIKWSDALRQVFRVLEFDRANTMVGSDGIPKAASSTAPYGYLHVDSPILNQPMRLPIIHRLDFVLANNAFDNSIMMRHELLVTYTPKRTFLGGRTLGFGHVLHYAFCCRKTLEHYYAVDSGIHLSVPAPERLFGKFRYFCWSAKHLEVKTIPNSDLEFLHA